MTWLTSMWLKSARNGFSVRIFPTPELLYLPVARKVIWRNESPGCTTTVLIWTVSLAAENWLGAEGGTVAAGIFRVEECGAELDFAAVLRRTNSAGFRIEVQVPDGA
jgi:hypothetical protein